MKNRIKLASLALVIILFGCMTMKDNSDFGEAPLYGKIYDLDNLPCANVTIMLNGKETSKTDINGRFVIKSLKQGEHTFEFIKKGFKTETVEFSFLNRTQALYQTMVSVEQVIPLIKQAIDEKEWSRAADHLRTALEIDKDNPVVNYLYAVYHYQLKDYEFAIEKLEGILSAGYQEAYVYITLADIYEHQFKNYKKAHENLAKYLELKDDKEGRLRLKVLESRLEKD